MSATAGNDLDIVQGAGTADADDLDGPVGIAGRTVAELPFVVDAPAHLSTPEMIAERVRAVVGTGKTCLTFDSDGLDARRLATGA